VRGYARLRVQDIGCCAKRQEHEDGVQKITAEAFVPFIQQGGRKWFFAMETVGVHKFIDLNVSIYWFLKKAFWACVDSMTIQR
jgi:hypothetical protein